jgi:uncharacterized protein (UPF0262 family)
MAMLIRAMADRYGFTPQQCAELTPAQAAALMAETPEEAKERGEGKITMTFEQARRLYGR